MVLLPEKVKIFISEHEKFLVIGHLEPDGDCVSSQLVLAHFLRRLGKKADLFSEGPFDRPEIFAYREFFRRTVESSDLGKGSTVVILDCSTPDRIGNLKEEVKGLPVMVIDHHSSGNDFGDVRWVDPSACSVTYLIQHLIEGLGYTPTPYEAELLLFGLGTDTGFFRHLGESSNMVFLSVSRLVAAGACPRKVFRMIYGGSNLAKIRLLGRALLKVERFFNDRVLITHQTRADIAGAESVSRGSDDLYRLLQSIKGCEVVAFIREEQEGHCSVGLRSNEGFDVGAIAESLGGGGHNQAAGFTCRGRIEEVKNRLLKIFAGHLQGP